MSSPQILNVVKATREHAEFVAANLYPEEVREIEAYGFTAADGVMFSFHKAKHCWVADSPDGVVCMWGVSSDGTLIGGTAAWMVTTTLLDKYARSVLRQIKPRLYELCEQCNGLEAFVDSRHERALRFFEWLGFDISNGIPVGKQGIPFHKITLRPDNVY